MAQVVNCQRLKAKTQVKARSVHVKFVVKKVALGEVSLKVLQFSLSPVNVILRLSIPTYHLAYEQQAH
jgi:hypothetical protein